MAATFQMAAPSLKNEVLALLAKIENPQGLSQNSFIVDQTFAREVCGTKSVQDGQEPRYSGSVITGKLLSYTLTRIQEKSKNGVNNGKFKAEGIGVLEVGTKKVQVKLHLGVAALFQESETVELRVQAGEISRGRNTGSLWLGFSPKNDKFATPEQVTKCLDAMSVGTVPELVI